MKKVRSGYCTWSNCQFLLEGTIDMVNMTFSLTSQQESCFKEILAGITTIQKLIGVDKWHQLLREIYSIGIALPGSLGLSRHI